MLQRLAALGLALGLFTGIIGCAPKEERAQNASGSDYYTEPQKPAGTETADTSGKSGGEAATPKDATKPAPGGETNGPAPVEPGMTLTQTDLRYKDIVVGKGKVAKAGDTVTVHYVGTLKDGTKFDSSRDRNEPFQCFLGEGPRGVIKGWVEGIAGMKVGGKRKLEIPPGLAYGPQGTPDGTIPPNSYLVFEVELLEVE